MAGSGQSADEEIHEAFSRALEDLRALGSRLVDTSVPDEHVWFRNLLIGIINCALYDYQHVQIGLKKYVPLAAWGVRNLLELKVVTQYVLQSAANANDFKNDLVIDIKEFYEQVAKDSVTAHTRLVSMMQDLAENEGSEDRERLLQLAAMEAARGPQTQIADAEAATYRQVMAEFGIKDTAKPKGHSQIASAIRESDDFAPLNKICSKILHRTAFSIAATTMPGSLDEVVPFFSARADNDVLAIYGLINDYVRENGTRPPED